MSLEKELVRLAVFAGLIARAKELDEDTYVYLWKKADNIAKRIRAFDERNRALARAVRGQAATRKGEEP